MTAMSLMYCGIKCTWRPKDNGCIAQVCLVIVHWQLICWLVILQLSILLNTRSWPGCATSHHRKLRSINGRGNIKIVLFSRIGLGSVDRPCLQPTTLFLLGFFFYDSIALLPPFAVFLPCHAVSQPDLFLSLAPTRLSCSDVARANHCDWSNDTSPSISIGVTLNPLCFPTEKNTSDSKTARPTQDIRT